MTLEETVKLLDLAITPEQWRAMRYLESHGFKFLVDFGYDNAVAKAQEHWRNRQ